VNRCIRLLGAACGVLATACAAAPELSPSSLREAVAGGEVSGPDDDFVVRVNGRETKPLDGVSCTGALLAPNLLVTALNCVAVFDAGARFSCESDGNLVRGSVGGWIGETLPPESIEVSVGTTSPPVVMAHGTSVLGTGSTVACIDNIAFVVLDTDLPARTVPIRIERPVVPGELMTVIGYGQSESTDTPRRRRSGVPVLDVGPDDTSGSPAPVAPRTFMLGDGPCPGDTGGPTLSDETGAVTGVFAFNFSGTCPLPGMRASVMKLSPYASLLLRAFDEAGQMPLLEGELPARAAAGGKAKASCALAAGNGPIQVGVPTLFVLVVLLARRRGAPSIDACSQPQS
jgi:hypothetical protein